MLTRLVPDIRKTAELVQEVSAASREQSTGIDQSNKALQDLDRVTQQNAAAAEELAAASSELSTQAQQLQSTVEFFKLDDHGTRRAAPSGGGARPPRSVSVRIPTLHPKLHAKVVAGATAKVAAKAAKAAKALPAKAAKPVSGNGHSFDLGDEPSDDELFERS
jgi:methyl-accepting chemotaxis protein